MSSVVTMNGRVEQAAAHLFMRTQKVVIHFSWYFSARRRDCTCAVRSFGSIRAHRRLCGTDISRWGIILWYITIGVMVLKGMLGNSVVLCIPVNSYDHGYTTDRSVVNSYKSHKLKKRSQRSSALSGMIIYDNEVFLLTK